MALVNFYKVVTLPGILVANSLYFVENGTYSESYVTDDVGAARSIGNTAMINALTSASITAALASYSAMEVVADITARNAISRSNSFMVLVIDASADTTVASGSALYAYDFPNLTYVKVAEYESMDMTITWASITGKPSSSVANIDLAVTNSHIHTNSVQLAKIGEDADGMTYNGAGVQSRWATLAW